MVFIVIFKALELDRLFCEVPVNNSEISLEPKGVARKRTQGAEGVCRVTEGPAMSHPVRPELPGTKSSTKENTWNYSSLQTHRQQKMVLFDTKGRKGPWPWKDLMSYCRGTSGQGSGKGLIEEGEMA